MIAPVDRSIFQNHVEAKPRASYSTPTVRADNTITAGSGPGSAGQAVPLRFVTFWQGALDLPMAGSVPIGQWARFGSAAFVDTWAAVIQPAGWTEADAVALN